MKDENKISNAFHELKQAADTLGVRPSTVLKAKEDLNTNDRTKIYEYIRSLNK